MLTIRRTFVSGRSWNGTNWGYLNKLVRKKLITSGIMNNAWRRQQKSQETSTRWTSCCRVSLRRFTSRSASLGLEKRKSTETHRSYRNHFHLREGQEGQTKRSLLNTMSSSTFPNSMRSGEEWDPAIATISSTIRKSFWMKVRVIWSWVDIWNATILMGQTKRASVRKDLIANLYHLQETMFQWKNTPWNWQLPQRSVPPSWTTYTTRTASNWRAR